MDSDPSADICHYADILRRKLLLIFYGPPGTGKTYKARQLAKYIVGEDLSKQNGMFENAITAVVIKEKEPLTIPQTYDKIKEQGLVDSKGKSPDRTTYTQALRMTKSDDSHIKNLDGKLVINQDYDYYPFIQHVTFHQSYSYEHFVEGIMPKITDDKQIKYDFVDGLFKEIVDNAKKCPSRKHILLIDEINRGNISKIFGELITLIEKDKRDKHKLQLAYSKKSFTVPENLYIIGTMNTADRSLIQIDAALRRRFTFVEMMPDYNLEKLETEIDGISLRDLLEKLNEGIRNAGWRENQIGHSYFLEIESPKDLQFVFTYEIIPLLQDLVFDDYKQLEEILSPKFVDPEKKQILLDRHTSIDIFKKALHDYLDKKQSSVDSEVAQGRISSGDSDGSL